jgi:hypothetical protein
MRFFLVFWLLAAPAGAATLRVGPTRALRLPSQAAAIARDGDTVLIDRGQYRDCAVWHANRLTIAGAGPAASVVIGDVACEDKGVFLLGGDATTLRNLTVQGAHNAQGNAAGIRLDGTGLTVTDAIIRDNQNGILSGADPRGTIRISGSTFIGNGACIEACAHGIYAGTIALLHIDHSNFHDQHVGHQIKSRALRTEVIDSSIADGPDGYSSYLVDIPDGGDLLLSGNRMEKGPHSDNPRVAVAIGEESGRNRTHRLTITGNSFRNDQDQMTIFVLNRTTTPAILSDNSLDGRVEALRGPGRVR